MKRKLTAFALVFALLASLSPAVAADELSATPTVEEILSEYHQKAFEAQSQGDTETASTWSRRGGSTKTLEEETVDTLTEAGYEAYNVTAGNYETLEAELQTDFAAMGLDPAGSYIVVIHGEPGSSETNGNSRVADPPTMDDFDDGSGGTGLFSHTYNETSYLMRYVTVTADQNTSLNQTTPVDLLDKYGLDDFWNDLNLPIALVSLHPQAIVAGILYTLISEAIPDSQNTNPSSLIFTGATNWTPTYIQVYDFEDSEWQWRAVFEYATAGYFINETHYDSNLNQNVSTIDGGTFHLIYSTNYDNRSLLLDYAAMYHNAKGQYRDTVEFVSYNFGDETLITHTRWSENFSYEPTY